jgi:8-oxo-dGTP pyrophosphatase MutT (NUDIX family)
MSSVQSDDGIGGDLPHGVVVVVRRPDGRYLFIRRAEPCSFAGYFCPISGAVEQGESYAETAVREAREEVGIEVRAVREVHEGPAASGRFVLHWWLCEHVAGAPGIAAPDEVAEVVWVRADDVHALGPHFEVDVALMRRLDAEL